MSQSATNLLIFPFNGNGREAASVVEDANRRGSAWNLLGFIDDDPEKRGLHFDKYPVLGGREQLARHPEAMVLAVPGRPETFRQRRELINSLGVPSERFATVVHPEAVIGIGCRFGFNSLIMANVVLTADVTVGNHVVILPNTVIAHDTLVGDYCLIGSGASISGGVTIGVNCYLGSGARIIQEVAIGERALIGLGAVVICDVAPGATVAGNPARIIREKP